MAEYTSNLHLEKPLAEEFYDVEVQNRNMEKIDAAVAGKLSREDITEEIKKAVEDGLLTAGDLGAVSEDVVGAPNGVAGLDENGQLPESQLPELDFDPSGSAAAVQANLTAHTANKSNPHGVTAAQVGAFTKAQTLTAETAALFGLGASAVPNEVFARLKSLLDAVSTQVSTKAEVTFGTYVGTGTYGSSNPTKITFPFSPRFVFISGDRSERKTMMAVYGSNLSIVLESSTYAVIPHFQNISWSEKSISFYLDGATDVSAYQLNKKGQTYAYIAIG